MDNKIGKYIKDQREERNLTQTELADKLYVSRQTISKWENGINKPDRVTFKKVENVLGSSFEDYKKKKRKEISDISKKKKKSLALGLFFMSCLVILTIYFAYYFISTYDKTQIYIVTGESERSVVTSGLYVETPERRYFSLGNIISLESKQIDEVELYYLKNDQEHLIIKGNPYTISIREDVGYEECFKEENRNYILNSLHMKIYYKDNIVDDVKLTLFKGYSNDKLFFRNSQPIGLKEQEGIEVDRFQKEKLVSKIKKNFKQDKENEELSTYTVKEKNLEKKFYYIDMSPFLFLEVYNGKRSIEEYTLSLLTSELNYTDKRTSNSWRYCEGEFVCDSDNCKISKEKVEEFFSLYDEVLN